ncbi:hypothetical protein [Mycobacterium sp.]|uniref:hypothetical protein n=1 Tax=Mycobacterium sp. TaxID=1785 RepID=UPI0031DC01F3
MSLGVFWVPVVAKFRVRQEIPTGKKFLIRDLDENSIADQPWCMTSPNMTTAFNAFYSAVGNPAVTTNTSPPGAVQSGIDYNALITAVGDFGLLTADAVNVFAEDFQAAITEALAAANLATSIVIAVEGGISAAHS